MLALSSCTSISPKFPETISTPNNGDKDLVTIINTSTVPPIEAVPFENFFPETSDASISLDPLYEEYLTGEQDLKGIDRNTNPFTAISDIFIPRTMYPYNVEFKPPRTVNFKESASTDLIFSTAEQLGYEREKIKHLSIHEAILLSGLITKEAINYANLPKMDAEKEKVMDVFYQSTIDATLARGNGVCGQYAELNMAIFNLFKTVNTNLKNTVMKYKVHMGTHYINSHAWNEVITPIKDISVKYIITSVDAVFLEHIQPKYTLSDIEKLYGTLNERRYYSGLYYLHNELADLYERLALYRPLIVKGKLFAPTEEMKKDYLNLAFEHRLKTCTATFEILRLTSMTNLEKMMEAAKEEDKSKIMEQLDDPVTRPYLLSMVWVENYERFAKKFNDNFSKLLHDITDNNEMSEADIIYRQALNKNILDAHTQRRYGQIKNKFHMFE